MRSPVSKIKTIPGRIAPYLRLRHARGHGIHSPFVFGLVRSALLYNKGGHGTEGELYNRLRECGVNRRRAGQIQNLHNYCDYRHAAIFDGTAKWITGRSGNGIVKIYTKACTPAEIETGAAMFSKGIGTLVVLSPRADRQRSILCRKLIERGDCISIDNRGFVIFIFGSGHAPRHYKL